MRKITKIQASTTKMTPGQMGDIGKDGENVKQDWELELIAERVSDLQRARRPIRLAQRDVVRPGNPGVEIAVRATARARTAAGR